MVSIHPDDLKFEKSHVLVAKGSKLITESDKHHPPQILRNTSVSRAWLAFIALNSSQDTQGFKSTYMGYHDCVHFLITAWPLYIELAQKADAHIIHLEKILGPGFHLHKDAKLSMDQTPRVDDFVPPSREVDDDEDDVMHDQPTPVSILAPLSRGDIVAIKGSDELPRQNNIDSHFYLLLLSEPAKIGDEKVHGVYLNRLLGSLKYEDPELVDERTEAVAYEHVDCSKILTHYRSGKLSCDYSLSFFLTNISLYFYRGPYLL